MDNLQSWLDAFSIEGSTRQVSLDVRNPMFFHDPNRVYAELHARCPTFFWIEQRRWYFTKYEHVASLLRDRRLGRQILHMLSREELGWPEQEPHLAAFARAERHSLLEIEPPEHTRLRSLVNRAFVSRHIDRMKPEIESLAHHLIDRFEGSGEVELLSNFAEIIPVTMIARMIGLPDEMAQQLLKWSHAYIRMYLFSRSREDEQEAERAAGEFADYLRSVIKARREQPRDDLLSHMIHTEHKGQYLTEDELISTAIVLLNAGHEATVHQIGNAVRLVLETDEEPATLFRDTETTERTVEETLRLAAPVHVFQRYVLEAFEMEGVEFRPGDTLGLILGAANVDPEKFSDPLAFQPSRNEGQHLSFGAGIHFCIGAPLARLELSIVLPILFQRLPKLRFLKPPQVKDIYHFHGLDALNLTWS